MNSLFDEINLDLPGRIYRSVLPFSKIRDKQGEVLGMYERNGVSAVVVLASTDEMQLYTGRDLLDVYRSRGWEVIYFPIDDFGLPERDAFISAVRSAILLAESGKSLAVHCHFGVGRTGMFLAVMAGMLKGLDGRAAITLVRRSIDAIDTRYQEIFVSDVLLGLT